MNILYPLKTEAAKSSKSLISDETENKVETLKPDGERRAEMRQKDSQEQQKQQRFKDVII